MNTTFHLQQRNIEREINQELGNLSSYAMECNCDTAIIIKKLDKELNIAKSNGDLIILIVRDRKPITVMYRRSKNQPLTEQALRVNKIKDYTKKDDTMKTEKDTTIKTQKEQEIESKILACHICTLAQVMKNCPICPFNIGLSVPVEIKTIVTL